MKLWKRLQNPFLLVGQGFLLGGILFFATNADSLRASSGSPTAESVIDSARTAP